VSTSEPRREREVGPEHVRAVREGHGANCSSIGSVIDTLFVTQVAAGALFIVVAAALAASTEKPSPSDATKKEDDE
jgi:hypothetical protein